MEIVPHRRFYPAIEPTTFQLLAPHSTHCATRASNCPFMFADKIKAHNFQASTKGKEGRERNREIQLREIVRQRKKVDREGGESEREKKIRKRNEIDKN